MSYCQENVDEIIRYIDKKIENSKWSEFYGGGLTDFYSEEDIAEASDQWHTNQEILDDPTDWRHELLIHPQDSPPGHKG